MKTARPGLSDPAILRQLAEERLKSKPPETTSVSAEFDSLKLIHELKVHQLELEMQNEELLLANAAAQDAIELYDLAPTGYFTISKDSEIFRTNLSGAALLGKVRTSLKDYRLSSFISTDTKPVFYQFLERVFSSISRESCEVVLEVGANPQKYVHITGIVTKNTKLCLISVTDISEHKSLEALNEVLLSSLPYPAMYIRKKDMVVLAVNKYASAMGVQVGGQCWREFMKTEYISDRDKAIADRFPGNVPADFHIRCTFCLADKCFASALEQSDHEVNAFDAVWDTYWIRVSSEVFLHYAVNISERKLAEDQIRLAHERLRRFVDSDIVGIIIADSTGSIIESNDYYLNTIGYSRSEFETGKVNWREITPPEWLYTDEKAINELRETGKCTPYEKEYIRKDGSRVFVMITDAILPGPFEQIAGFILDITERKNAEKALRESEQKYRELIENSPDAIIIYSNGEIIMVNRESVHLMAADSPEELLGKTVLQFVHPDYKTAVIERMGKMAEDGIVLPINEERFIRCDGTEVDVEVKAMPLMFDNKTAVQLIIRDITERKLAEEELKNSEAKFRYLFESNDDGIVIFPVIGEETPLKMIDLNANAAKMLGYTKAEMLELTIDQIEKVRIPERTETRKNELLTRGISIFETTILHKDGHEVQVELKSKLINYNNQPALMYIVRDITERRKSEQQLLASEIKFRELFESNSDGIVIFSLGQDGAPSLILDFNENAARMVGLTKEEYWIAEHTEFEKDVTSEELDWRKKELITKGFLNFETIVLHKDGHKIDVEIKIMLIKYNNQPALMNIVRDITDRKNAEIQLQVYAIELSKQIAEKNKFFSIIAHDLRGPFNGFLGLTQIMTERISELTMEELQQMALSMKVSATNLFRLLENLLHWARIEQGVIPFSPQQVPLHLLTNECIAMAYEPAMKKGIELNCAVSDKIEVFADTNMLQAIIRNLISNAVKYTSAGGTINLTAQVYSDKSVEIAVQDSGIGMSAAMQESLFRLNAQNNRKGTAGEPSTGLGLIICREFIEKHGGKLRIESEVGKGSIFRFILPCSSPGKEKEVVLQKDPAKVEKEHAKGLKILIAEDDETSEMLISIVLKSFSREILKVSTGADAIEICRNNPDIDLIMMDIKMPVLNGYEATLQIRKFNKKVVIIAQTAFGNNSDREMASESGFNDYISKPLSVNLLKDTIQKHFGV